jgi:hypothetical protein
MIPISKILEDYKPGYKSKHKSSEPADPKLWAGCVAKAKKKFDNYPSQVANWWVSKCYRKAGGKFK